MLNNRLKLSDFKESLIQWKKQNALMTHGVIVGCSHHQEWLLPWWWMHFQMYNSHYPVTFFDFGDMSTKAKNWCRQRGQLDYLPARSIESFVTSKENVSSQLVSLWENLPNIWEIRLSWFKKPFACLQSPYKNTLWIDLDCQVRKSLSPLFTFFESSPEIAIVEEPANIMKMYRDYSELLENEIEYNTGILGFKHESNLIQKWAKKCLENNKTLRGDQEILSRLLFEEEIKPITFPLQYVQRATFSPTTNEISPKDDSTIILHWCGIHKQFIQIEIEFLKHKAFMHFSLESD